MEMFKEKNSHKIKCELNLLTNRLSDSKHDYYLWFENTIEIGS